MSNDPQTFEEARREFTEEREEEGEEPFYAEESDAMADVEDLGTVAERIQTITEASPRELSRLGLRVRESAEDRAEGRLGPIRVRLGQLEGVLDDLALDLQTAETQAEILRNIAQSNLFMAERLSILTQTQVEVLDATFQILNSLEPFNRITVSGTNDIEDADTAEPVVPDSDNVSIPTRILIIKASDNNQDEIAIGDDETDPDSGYILNSGENLILNIDLRDETLYMASDTAGETVELLGFT